MSSPSRAPERPTFHPALGEFFAALRTARNLTQSDVASLAQRRGLRALTRQVLLRLENGKTKNPAPPVIEALARLYNIPYQTLAADVAAYVYGATPTDSGSAVMLKTARTLSKKIDNDHARCRRLYAQLIDLQSRIKVMLDSLADCAPAADSRSAAARHATS